MGNKFGIHLINLLNNKFIKILFGILLFFAVYIQFNKISASNAHDLKVISPYYFFIAFIFFLYSLLAHALTWHLLINSIDGKINFCNSLYVYFTSGLLRYLPGNYWYIFSRSAMGMNLGIDLSKSISSTSAEILFNLFIGLFLSIIGILWGIKLEVKQLYWLLLFFLICVILFILLYTFSKSKRNDNKSSASSKMRSFFHDISKLQNLSFINASIMLYLFLSVWISQGFSLFFVISAFTPLNITAYPIVMFSYVISWVVGFINPITPNGLGIREALLMITLTPTISAPIILAASIMMRLLGLVGESILAFSGWFLSKRSIKKEGF